MTQGEGEGMGFIIIFIIISIIIIMHKTREDRIGGGWEERKC
jgi:hypothetical protein